MRTSALSPYIIINILIKLSRHKISVLSGINRAFFDWLNWLLSEIVFNAETSKKKKDWDATWNVFRCIVRLWRNDWIIKDIYDVKVIIQPSTLGQIRRVRYGCQYWSTSCSRVWQLWRALLSSWYATCTTSRNANGRGIWTASKNRKSRSTRRTNLPC